MNFVNPSGLIIPAPGFSSRPPLPKPIGPRNLNYLIASVKGTLTSPGTAFGTTTSGNEFIFDLLKKRAVKAVSNQSFPSSIASGMRSKIIVKETAEATAAFGGASKFFKVAGEWGGPALDVVLGAYTISEDLQKYSGNDQVSAIAVTTIAIGVGIFLASTTLPVLLGLGLGVGASIFIDLGANIAKDWLTEEY